MNEMYCLWIGGKKVHNLEQLNDNFELDSVEMYYHGGGLVRWLKLCGEMNIADRIEKIDAFSDVSEQLAEIFGQPKPIRTMLSDTEANLTVPKRFEEANSSFTFEALNSEGSFPIIGGSNSFSSKLIPISSFETSSFVGSSFNQSLFNTGSGAFLTGSLALESTSFFTMSFSLLSASFMVSSFHQYEYEFATSGSFNSLSSFNYGSFSLATGGFTNSISSFNTAEHAANKCAPEACDNNRCIPYGINETEASTPSPQEKILQNFSACSLNRFGYGLHLI